MKTTLGIEYDVTISGGAVVSDTSCRKALKAYGIRVKGLGNETVGQSYHRFVRLTGTVERNLREFAHIIAKVTGCTVTHTTLGNALTSNAVVYGDAMAKGITGAQEQNRDCLNSIGTARRVSCRSISPVSKVRGGAV